MDVGDNGVITANAQIIVDNEVGPEHVTHLHPPQEVYSA